MIDTNETIVAFMQLFQGNHTAVGTEEGGCLRLEDGVDSEESGRLRLEDGVDSEESGCLRLDGEHMLDWEGQIEGHLVHGQPIGVYPMVRQYDTLGLDRWAVHWGCIDYDEGEERSWVHAVNTRMVLERFGITGWIERSRSKGYHVWVFLSDWTPAAGVRQALLAAAQLAGAPTREINPKQETLGEGQLGNYVRLPYPGALESGFPNPIDKRVVVRPTSDTSIELPLDTFVKWALESRCDSPQLMKLAEFYKPAKISRPKRVYVQPEGLEEEVHSRMSGIAYHIYKNGTSDEYPDRSDQLFRLACELVRGQQHTNEEMLRLVREADADWGKFHSRDDCEDRLQDLLTRALEIA